MHWHFSSFCHFAHTTICFLRKLLVEKTITPSNSLPDGGNYTYVFSLDPLLYKEQNAIDISALLIELDSGRVLEAAPNFVNIRLGSDPMEEPTLKYSNLIPPQLVLQTIICILGLGILIILEDGLLHIMMLWVILKIHPQRLLMQMQESVNVGWNR